MSEKFIFEENDQFIIKREIEGVLHTFGSYPTLDEAILAREELDEDGWPIPIEIESIIPEEKYGQYIKKENKKFLVSREILGVEIIFGMFDSLELAKNFKYKLIEFGWDVRFTKGSNPIKKTKTGYKIVKKINGENVTFGSYKLEEEAKNAREKLINANWGLDESFILSNLGIKELAGKNHHIGKAGQYNIIINFDEEGYTFYGFYRRLNSAIRQRDNLIRKNWYKPPVKEKLKNISKVKNCYKITNTIYGERKSYGYYYSLAQALKIRDLLIKNNWDLEGLVEKGIIKKPLEYRYIKEESGKYTILNKIKGQYREFGRFDELEEAIEYRNYLETNNWKIHTDKNPEIKYDEFIYIFEDGKYYIMHEINGEMRIFGKFDSILEAIYFRETCIECDWELESISKDEYEIKSIRDEISFEEFSVMNEFVEDFDEISFTVSVENSYKTKEFNIKRAYLEKIIPKLKYEDEIRFLIDENELLGTLEINPKLTFDLDEKSKKYLKTLSKIDKKSLIRIYLELNHGTYWGFDLNNCKLTFNTLFSEKLRNKKTIDIPREVSSKLIPILPYETECTFSFGHFDIKGKLELNISLKFKEDSVIYTLYESKEDNEEIEIKLSL